MSLQTLPILYSLRHCPYAIRARIAILKSAQSVWLRDIKLDNKPTDMLAQSCTGTVPMLVLPKVEVPKRLVVNEVFEESLSIMVFMLKKNDPLQLLTAKNKVSAAEIQSFITAFDAHFIPALAQYKCAKRYHRLDLLSCRQVCEGYLDKLEQRLTQHLFLMSNTESLADIALMPFIRQFAKVERQWYLQSPYPKLRAWLSHYLQSTMFTKVMAEHDLWVETHANIIFGGHENV